MIDTGVAYHYTKLRHTINSTLFAESVTLFQNVFKTATQVIKVHV